ncbi:MAG: hypothetical protein QW701_06150 [Candidatus Nezhaarchaeales archaeon]
MSAIVYLSFLLILSAISPQALAILPLGLLFTLIFVIIGVYETYRKRSLARELKEGS